MSEPNCVVWYIVVAIKDKDQRGGNQRQRPKGGRIGGLHRGAHGTHLLSLHTYILFCKPLLRPSPSAFSYFCIIITLSSSSNRQNGPPITNGWCGSSWSNDGVWSFDARQNGRSILPILPPRISYLQISPKHYLTNRYFQSLKDVQADQLLR